MSFSSVLSNSNLGSSTFTIWRVVKSVNNKGRLCEKGTELLGTGIIQPAPGNNLALLAEGEGTTSGIIIFSETPLEIGDRIGLQAEKTPYYKITHLELWPCFNQTLYRASALLEDFHGST